LYWKVYLKLADGSGSADVADGAQTFVPQLCSWLQMASAQIDDNAANNGISY
jgi:hypothetical protein